jgi:HEAT repeat protein
LISRTQDPDSAVRFWAALGLAVAGRFGGPEAVSSVAPALEAALEDESVSVRLTAAEGLFDLGRYEKGLPILIEALDHPSVDAQIRAGCILDSQPPDANQELQPAIGPLQRTVDRFEQQSRFGATNNPFKRALKAISGDELYYRWGPGASGSPRDEPEAG